MKCTARLIVLTAAAALSLCLSAAAGERAFRRGDWPFCPPDRPAVPPVSDPVWPINPIDAFVMAELDAVDLRPSPAADKLVLLRRVTYDLTGLPPSLAEQAAFTADAAPGAYERVVDRLLASPAHGEHWARHWLDLVRYAETDGFKADDHRPHAYKYRDWVIEAFNADMPYDRFVCLQLAGDEILPGDPHALVATGFNRLYPDEYNAANLQQRRQEILDDITATAGSVFLGLTVGCAQCHDHKFDPLTQVDYYGLQAFFAPLVARDDLDMASAEQRQEHHRRQAEWEASTASLRAEIDSLIGGKIEAARQDALLKFRADIQEAVRLDRSQRTAYQEQIARMALKQANAKAQDVVAKLSDEEKARYKQLEQQLQQFDAVRPRPLAGVMAATDLGGIAPPTHRLESGDWRHPAEELEPSFPAFLAPDESPWTAAVVPPVDGGSTGRRTALARWLTRDDHPLTARVMVNRLWQHHFGSGIVDTPNDFGAQGAAPSHPRLLDWLAAELIQSRWSLKHVHRLMVTSATYCQTSRFDRGDPLTARALARDSQNRRLWRARRRRLEAEAIHDSMLAVSGQYNPRMFGPSARPPLPAGVSPNYAWTSDADPSNQHRRGIYVLAKRNLRYPLFDAFDAPDMHHACGRRSRTTTAVQALALFNGALSLDCARHWAGRLLATQPAHSDDRALVSLAVVQAVGRPAHADEVASACAFLDRQAELIRAVPAAADTTDTTAMQMPEPCPSGCDPARAAALVDFCHALLNANEFIYID